MQLRASLHSRLMITSRFIEFSGDTILNIAHITAVHKVTVTLTDFNRQQYEWFPVVDDKAYTSQLYVTDEGGRNNLPFGRNSIR